MVLMEEFEFKVVYGLGSGDYRSVNKVLKVVKFGVGVGVGGSLGWGFDRGIGGVVDIANGLIFGIDDVSGLGSSNGFFCRPYYGRRVG